MHMADALISPAVGGAMWLATAGVSAYCAKRLRGDEDDRRVPLMGVLGAFIFSAQMLNFSIPGTGSSGHLGGGMILAILLGPHAAFLTIASVLAVQALFFADGGLLALGCNIFNLGFFPSFVAYSLVYRRIAGNAASLARVFGGCLLSGIVALELGSLAVVLQTGASGISSLPMLGFLLLMAAVHLAIGVVEGLATFAVVNFVRKARPEILDAAAAREGIRPARIRIVVLCLAVAAIGMGGVLSWFASSNPDGLEWSLFRASGQEELEPPKSSVYEVAAQLQSRTGLLPDYEFKGEGVAVESYPAINAGKSIAGLVGAGLSLCLIVLLATFLRRGRATP